MNVASRLKFLWPWEAHDSSEKILVYPVQKEYLVNENSTVMEKTNHID